MSSRPSYYLDWLLLYDSLPLGHMHYLLSQWQHWYYHNWEPPRRPWALIQEIKSQFTACVDVLKLLALFLWHHVSSFFTLSDFCMLGLDITTLQADSEEFLTHANYRGWRTKNAFGSTICLIGLCIEGLPIKYKAIFSFSELLWKNT